MSQRRKRVWLFAFLSVGLQCALLAVGEGRGNRSLPAAGVCFVLLALPVAALRLLPKRSSLMLLGSGAFGGLGMIVGSMIDRSLALPLPACHAGVEMVDVGIFNWMTGLMFLACISGCWWCCPRCGSFRRDLLGHSFGAIGMYLGMLAGGRLLADRWGTMLGVAEGMHLAMLVGMLVGVAVTEIFYFSIFRRIGTLKGAL